jgi:hypothetical protein
MSADAIVNAAELAWEVIKAGAASAEINSSRANAVPDVDDWRSLSGTQGPNGYRMYYSRGFVWPFDDYDHVQIEIKLRWEYGARYRGGGAYIPNLWVEVPECFCGWPWTANISLETHAPTNAGTQDAPIARLPVTLKGDVGSGAEHHHVEWGFILFGDGSSQRL